MPPVRRAKAAALAAMTTASNPDATNGDGEGDGAFDLIGKQEELTEEIKDIDDTEGAVAGPRTPPTGSSMATVPLAAADRIARPLQVSSSRAHLPTVLQYPLVVVLSFCMSSLAYSLLTELSKGSIALVSRSLKDEEVAILAGWRMLELAICWFGKYDALDVAALNLLSHLPLMYLLSTFYGVSPATSTAALSIDVLSTLVPFLLLRPLSGAHTGDKTVVNRELLSDLPIAAYTIALATGIYSVILVLALRLYLPRVLVLHFQGIPSLIPAYTASYLSIIPISVLLGAAARTLVFTPSTATATSQEDTKIDRFNPVEASLSETFMYNVWGYHSRTKVVIQRTAVATVITGMNTYLHCVMTINGVESAGSLAYAGVWTLAAALAGTALALVSVE